MRHHLKAVFSDPAAAGQVLDQLIAAGFPPAEVRLASPSDPASDAEHAGLAAGVRRRVTAWLIHAMGQAPPDDPPLADKPGTLPFRHLVYVDVLSDTESIRALGILEASDAVYIEDWRKPEVPSAVAWTPAAPRVRYPPGTAPGALQYRRIDTHLFGTQQANASYPHGTTFQELMDDTAAPEQENTDRP